MANDITILSCPQCGFPRIRDCGNGLYQCDDCGTHFDKDENIVLTEQEWLQTATTEQLAEFLAEKFDLCGAGCHNCFLAEECLTKAKDGDYRTQEQMIADWLKQQHTVKE